MEHQNIASFLSVFMNPVSSFSTVSFCVIVLVFYCYCLTSYCNIRHCTSCISFSFLHVHPNDIFCCLVSIGFLGILNCFSIFPFFKKSSLFTMSGSIQNLSDPVRILPPSQWVCG